MAGIDSLLNEMVRRDASDLHLRATLRPHIRESGDMIPLSGSGPLTPEIVKGLLQEIMPPSNRRQFDEKQDTDFAYELPGVGRFRVNVLMGSTGVGAVFRVFPKRVPTADQLGLPQAVRDFCSLNKGLVVVTGPTGSGKSTTLAAMIDLINKTRSDHIITIEDPIEFVHIPQKCLITQREVHSHTESFASALRAALREDPDIVLVGEMRDLETIEIAIETAETGHLVFGTLHTNTAATTVNRIIDKFPANRQNQIRTMLSDSLKGVVAQTLCKKIPKGRVAAMEILVVTTGIASNIREGKTHQIPSAMQTGKRLGMQTFNDALMKLAVDGLITPEDAYAKSIEKENMLKMMAAAGLTPNLEAKEAPAPASPPAEAPMEEASVPVEDFVNRCMEAVRRDPENSDALNNLAWVLATSDNPNLRNAAEALHAAQKAYELTQGRNPAVLDTLGAAYAESGRFDVALDWARKGLKLAQAMGEGTLAGALIQRIRLYEAGQPLRQKDALNHEGLAPG